MVNEKQRLLDKLVKKKVVKDAVRGKVGFKEGLKRSLKLFGASTSHVFGSLKSATGQVLGDATTPKDEAAVKNEVRKVVKKNSMLGDLDSVIKGMPD